MSPYTQSEERRASPVHSPPRRAPPPPAISPPAPVSPSAVHRYCARQAIYHAMRLPMLTQTMGNAYELLAELSAQKSSYRRSSYYQRRATIISQQLSLVLGMQGATGCHSRVSAFQRIQM